MSETAQPGDADLLASGSGNRLVNLSQVTSELRRRRKVIIAVALIGAFLGLLVSVGLPKTTRSDTTVFVQLPANVDPARGMSTELALLETRAVAEKAAASPGLSTNATQLHSQYTGAILSDNILRVTAQGPSARVANARATAVANAYLAVRTQVYNDQLQALVTALRNQQTSLQQEADALTQQTQSSGTSPSQLANMVATRDALNTQVQDLETTIDTDTAGMASVVQSSRVIDIATPRPVSTMKAAALNMVSGFLAAGFLALGVVVLIAITSTRVRRRVDIAAALGAPVRVSVGPIIARRRHHLRSGPEIAGPALEDLELVVRHLQAAVAAAPNSSLVIVSIDSLRVTSLAVQTLERALVAEGRDVQVVNVTGRGEREESIARARADEQPADAEVALVVATLDPGRGADHLREWATDVVVFATAGRSTRTKLEANATMIRSASLQLRSVVLVNSDDADDSLGIIPSETATTVSVPEATSESQQAAQTS